MNLDIPLEKSMCVCVCVCVPMSTHCTCVFQIPHKALSVVYFQFTHLLGRPRYVGNVYLYCALEASEVMVTICVIIVLCGMMMMKGREKVKPMPAHSLLFWKAPRGLPGLMSPSTNVSPSTVLYAFSTYILQKGLEFNPGLWCTI